MKKRSLKIMSVVLAGVMTTGMILGGCSAGGDKENGGNKEASKELNLWMHNGQAFVDETKKLAENYEKETGVKINIQTFPYDAMSQKMKAAFTAGNEPDIMQVFGAWIPTYMNQKLLAEVPEELSANFETDYLQGAVDGYAKDGTYYGVPIEMNVEYGLFYNREDAAAAGVPDGPKTFDDVMKIAKNSAKFNGDVQEYGGLEFYNGDNFAALFLSWIMQNGGDFWNEDQTKFVLTSPEAKEAWQKLVDLVTVEKVTDTYIICSKLNILNSMSALIIPFMVSGFGIFLCRQFAESIPNDILEAARIDGAGEWRIFFGIVIHTIKPAIAALCIFIFMGRWNDYLWPLIAIVDEDKMTLPLALNFFNSSLLTDYCTSMSAGVLVMIPIIIIYFIFQKQFIEGITMTGIK